VVCRCFESAGFSFVVISLSHFLNLTLAGYVFLKEAFSPRSTSIVIETHQAAFTSQ